MEENIYSKKDCIFRRMLYSTDKKDKIQQNTFFAAFVQFIGEKFGWEQVGHMFQLHHPFNFQLLWPDRQGTKSTQD